VRDSTAVPVAGHVYRPTLIVIVIVAAAAVVVVVIVVVIVCVSNVMLFYH